MSRHLDVLRRAKAEAELFAEPEPSRRAASRAAAQPPLNPDGRDRDQWQQLIHQLFRRRRPGARFCLGLASPTVGEGTSYVAAHLAAELARAIGQPTLLLEANLHAPAQAGRHGVEPQPGFSHLLADRQWPLDHCLQQTAFPQLWLLPAGSDGKGFGAAADWIHLRPVFQSLRERFQLLVVDLPPVNRYVDGLMIAPLLDGAILVVEADRSRREAIQHAAARLRQANPNLLGAILNRRKFFIPEPLYRRL